MKKNALFSGLVSLMAAAMVSSCADTFDPGVSDTHKGRISLSVDLNTTVAAPQTASRAGASADGIEVSDLALRLSATDGSYEKSWTSVSDLEASNEVPVGQYLFEAYYGDQTKEGFELPYYYGSQDITVLENRTSDISLKVSLANAMVTVIYTDAVKDYFSTINGSVSTAAGNEIAYGTDENRAVYVAPGTVNINVDVVKQNGVAGKLSAMTFKAEPRHHYTVTFDVNGGNVGKGTLNVTFNSDLEEEVVELDLSDEILIAPAPEINATGFESGQTLTFVEGLPCSETLRATIIAQAGLQSVVMTTSSATLLAQGWPAEVDFATADASTLAKLVQLGLKYPGLDGKFSQMALLDFTNVVSHLNYVEGNDNITAFNVIAKDKASKMSDPLALSIEIEKLALEVVDKGALLQDETELEIILGYNGQNLAENAKFEVANNRGTWDTVTPISIEAVSRGMQTYSVKLPVPGEGNVTYRISCGNLQTEQQTVKRGVGIAYDENDVFATHAAIYLVGDDADASTSSILISTDGANFTEKASTAADKVTLSFDGLTPATKYYVKAHTGADTYTKAVSFTTETPAQLPDAGFESWTSEKKGDYQYLWKVNEGTPWATVNDRTIADHGSGSGSGINTGGCAYKATSGTIPANGRSNYSNSYGGTFGTSKNGDGHTTGNATLHSDKGHQGNAALIRTVGFGSGNNAGSGTGNPASGFNTCKSVAAGELYLGKYDGEAQYTGYTFGSRPSAISFYYHYTSYGSSGDYGDCEVIVKDADGKVIASNSCTFTAQDAYTLKTLDLSYAAGSKKAASIMVRFKSSANPSLTNNSTWLYGPGNKNVSGGEYVGSELYVDDIELIY